ncbi:pyruvate dehydrogenase (acetyl-transferring) E1 component subunit alpha, partial [Halorubrum sp. E3]
YRFGAHTTADDPTVYRDDDEVESWKRKDPIARLESYLRCEGVLDDERVAEIESVVEARVAEAIEAAESEARPMPEEMFEHAYAELPPELERQYEAFAAFRDAHGDEAFLEE